MRRRLLEYGLVLTGSIFLGLFSISALKFWRFHQQAATVPIKAAVRDSTRSSHPVIGRVSIRRLGFTEVIVEGDDDESLSLAAGHMPGTALPGQNGNVVISGHRDSAFWPLRNVREGDRIDVESPSIVHYRVQQMSIVEPDDTRVLADTKDAILTLVTCYPFRHVGPAPQRFIVRAKLIP